MDRGDRQARGGVAQATLARLINIAVELPQDRFHLVEGFLRSSHSASMQRSDIAAIG
jgi:hypothetical protein